MRVGIFSFSDIGGGAAIAAYRLHLGLLSIGHDSVMFVHEKKTKDDSVISIIPEDITYEQEFSQENQHNFLQKHRTKLTNTRFSMPFPGYDLSGIEELKLFDVINIHWVDNFLSPESILYLYNLKKRIFWTFHDQWPLTGGCHYTAGCMGFMNECDKCPQVNNPNFNIANTIFQHKKSIFNYMDFSIITPSKWLEEIVGKSSLFGKNKITTIHNGIDHEIFTDRFRESYRGLLSIPRNASVLLFGAANNTATRKGFPYIIKALTYLSEKPEFIKMINNNLVYALIIGQSTVPDNIPIPVISTGYIEDELDISKAYAAADMLLLPSLEDNFPNQMLESLACKTPVIGFDTGGIKELIKNDINGVVVPSEDYISFGEAILDLITNKKKALLYGEQGRILIEEKFKLSDSAHQHIAIFEKNRNWIDKIARLKPVRIRKKGMKQARYCAPIIKSKEPYIQTLLLQKKTKKEE